VALELDILHCDLGELPRSLRGRQVLAEVEEELGEHHLGEEAFRKPRGRLALDEPSRRRSLALRRGHQARDLGQERRQRLGDAVTRRSIVVQSRLDTRLGIERDGAAIVERQDAPGDRGPTGDWRGRHLREGALGDPGEKKKKRERENEQTEHSHTAPENITTVVDRRGVACGYLFSCRPLDPLCYSARYHNI